MKLDDELCLCFHVTRRKLIQYVRIHRPAVASQLSECFGAGTGCGWCRPYLRQIFEREQKAQWAMILPWPTIRCQVRRTMPLHARLIEKPAS